MAFALGVDLAAIDIDAINAISIEALKSVVPSRHVKPNNKLANEMTKDFLDEGEQSLVISTAKAMLEYRDGQTGINLAKFTPYDREVHDGVVTLYEAGNLVITPAMVYRAMNGMSETEKISPQAMEAVTNSLEKSRRIMATIEFAQEAKAYNKECGSTRLEGLPFSLRQDNCGIWRAHARCVPAAQKALVVRVCPGVGAGHPCSLPYHSIVGVFIE
ncbi:MAG: hypothetical protein FWG10_12840 [Eubacteriaceae bacterium]|nr:hypothetical protein [Eubacteriaceae bacterium]